MELSKNEVELLVTLVVGDGRLNSSDMFDKRDMLAKFNLEKPLSSANNSEECAKWTDDVESESRRDVDAKKQFLKIRDNAEQILRGGKQNLNYLIDERIGPISPKEINMLYDIIKGGGHLDTKILSETSFLNKVGLMKYVKPIEGYKRVVRGKIDSGDAAILTKQIDSLSNMIVDKSRRALYRGNYYNVDWKSEQSNAPDKQEQQQRSRGMKR